MNEQSPARKRILEAAFALFTSRGIDATTTREIAAAAEVNEVTLFRHFGTKDGLVRAAVEHSVPAETLPRLDDLQLTGNLQADLVTITRTVLEIHREREEFFHFVFANIVQRPDNRQFFSNMQIPLLDWIENFFAPFCKSTPISAKALSLEFIGSIVMRSIRRIFLENTFMDDETYISQHALILASAIDVYAKD